jgi:hypothetical protein
MHLERAFRRAFPEIESKEEEEKIARVFVHITPRCSLGAAGRCSSRSQPSRCTRSPSHAVVKNAFFRYVRLSRACLGKMSLFSIKTTLKRAFSHLEGRQPLLFAERNRRAADLKAGFCRAEANDWQLACVLLQSLHCRWTNLQKRISLFSFSYVCPEPVLVK